MLRSGQRSSVERRLLPGITAHGATAIAGFQLPEGISYLFPNSALEGDLPVFPVKVMQPYGFHYLFFKESLGMDILRQVITHRHRRKSEMSKSG